MHRQDRTLRAVNCGILSQRYTRPSQFPRAKYIDTGPFKADDEWGSISGGHLVKAVRTAPPWVEVVDVDEPEGEGELVWVVATEICAPDLKYLRWGSTQIAGHEFAGVLPHTAGRLQLHRQTTGSDHHADRRTQDGREERRALLEQRRAAAVRQLRRLAIELTDIDRQLDEIEQSER